MLRSNFGSTLLSATAWGLIPIGLGFIAGPALALDIPAGPIWNNEDAKLKCPVAAHVYQTPWNGQWKTTIPGRMSVCGTNLRVLPTIKIPGDVFAGPIWNNEDARVKCPVAAYAARGTWNGQWKTVVHNKMSVCGLR